MGIFFYATWIHVLDIESELLLTNLSIVFVSLYVGVAIPHAFDQHDRKKKGDEHDMIQYCVILAWDDNTFIKIDSMKLLHDCHVEVIFRRLFCDLHSYFALILANFTLVSCLFCVIFIQFRFFVNSVLYMNIWWYYIVSKKVLTQSCRLVSIACQFVVSYQSFYKIAP